VTSVIEAGVALVGCFKTAAQIFRKGGVRVDASNSHQDYFTRSRRDESGQENECDTRRIVRSLWSDLAFDVTGELLPQEQVLGRESRGIGRSIEAAATGQQSRQAPF
jgi:hypothetical protein